MTTTSMELIKPLLSALAVVGTIGVAALAPAQDTSPPPPDSLSSGVASDPSADPAASPPPNSTPMLSGSSGAVGGDAGTIAPSAQSLGDPLNFQAHLFTGRFTYTVPIAVAPGRQG